MHALAWPALPVSSTGFAVPVWIWPLAVCFAAWLFRCCVRGASAPVSRSRFREGWSLFFADIPGRPGRAPSPAPSQPGGGDPDEPPRATPWWKFFGNCAPGPERIEIRARKTLGPQLQFLVLSAGDWEYHVLAQAGAAPQTLSARNLSSLQAGHAGADATGASVRPRRARRARAGLRPWGASRRAGRCLPSELPPRGIAGASLRGASR